MKRPICQSKKRTTIYLIVLHPSTCSFLISKGGPVVPDKKKKIAANIGFQKKKKESNISDMICKDVSNNINMIYQPAASKNLKLSK